MTTPNRYLACPHCGSPVTTLPARTNMRGMNPNSMCGDERDFYRDLIADGGFWVENDRATCPSCHTKLIVRCDEDNAYLTEEDN